MPSNRPETGTGASTATTHGRRRTTSWFGAFLAFVLFAACAVGIYYLSADARREINALATTNADSTQWALAQSEVELLALLSETHAANSGESPPSREDLRRVRRRFDVFYSRIVTMRESAVLAKLRENETTRENLFELAAMLDRMIPLIDGSDDALASGLTEISQELESARLTVRNISLAGVEHFSRLSDQQRTRVSDALFRLGTLTFLLVAALSAMVLALFKSNRRARIDNRKREEAQRRTSVIVATALDAVVVVNRKGKVIEFNSAAERIFGYTRDEIIGSQMADKIIPEKFHAAHEAGMKRYLETGEKRVVGKGRVQLEAKHKSGRLFPVELSISSAKGPDGEIFISYLRDISSRLAKQEELVRARDEAVAGERAKADLIAVMSHEMRTPLNGIVGALELLKSTDLDKTQTQMADVMGTSANMLLQRVNDVLDISRLESGAAEKVMRPFDPVATTKVLLDSLRVTAKEHGNLLELDALDPDFSLVLGDEGKVRQILTNLVGNAIKFTKHGTIRVEIEPYTSEEEWELRVIDEGIGISEEDQRRIFDDFVTLDPSYTRAQEGSGLGLGIVRRLVEHLGGQIGVESDPGEGSVFWVRLPTNVSGDISHMKPKVKAADTPPPAQAEGLGKSILLVEDNAINRLIAREMLQKQGHTVIEAHNGLEGVELAKMREFDAILMDISMPDMDGLEATKHIVSGSGPNAKTPVFAVTAHAMPADIERFKSAGMTDVLIKPIGLERLRNLLEGKNPAQSESAVRSPYWDEQTQEELREAIGPDRHKQLLALYIQEMNDACKSTFAIKEIDDVTTLKEEVHRLAGSASILGAHTLRTLLHRIETNLVEGDLECALEQIGHVNDCWIQTREAVVEH